MLSFGRYFRRTSPEDTPLPEPVEYLNAHAASSAYYNEHYLDPGYRQLVKFFGCGLMDRTQTLQPGFPYQVLTPLPTSWEPATTDLTTLCDQRGQALLTEAVQTGQKIRLLWSGGIDSTAALSACLKAAEQQGALDLLEVWLTPQSVRENKRYYKQIIKPRLHYHKVWNITRALKPDALIVTGELGDQLFGSLLAFDYIETGELFQPWQAPLTRALDNDPERICSAETMLQFLQPQLDCSPVPLHSLFDMLWWLNFSLKWQNVQLRLAARMPHQYTGLRQVLRHFFDTPAFQNWSVHHHDEKIERDWPSYKMPLKHYIYDFFPDRDYLLKKCKEASLRHLTDPSKARRVQSGGVETHVTITLEGKGSSLCDSDGDGE